MAILLVIDDEESVRYSFRRVFGAEGVQVLTAATAAEGLALFRDQRPDAVLLDLQLPDRNGLEVFREIHARDPRRPVVFLTAHGTAETAIEAMKGGAFDYLVKPVDLERLSQVLERAFEAARLMSVPAVLPADDRADRIVGRSAVMQEMSKAVGRLAPQDVNVLILGESGTGKELVARALYQHSKRADRPFLAVNCAAIPETLLESELFGHEKGSFTGADRRRVGKFEQCNGGTLLLDEIGDMTPALQAKMLRVLQDQRFERLGGPETVQTDVRVLAATNQDLLKLNAEGRFRKDLYYRLSAVSLRVPSLRERLEDVSELAHFFLFRFDRELNLDLRGFSPEVLELLQRYSWPGNVRELQGVVKQAMLNASGRLILTEFLPAHLPGTPNPHPNPPPPAEGGKGEGDAEVESASFDLTAFIESRLPSADGRLYGEVIGAVERILLARVLRHTHGHQIQASELLGISRGTLRHRMRTLGMTMGRTLMEDESSGTVKPDDGDDGARG